MMMMMNHSCQDSNHLQDQAVSSPGVLPRPRMALGKGELVERSASTLGSDSPSQSPLLLPKMEPRPEGPAASSKGVSEPSRTLVPARTFVVMRSRASSLGPALLGSHLLGASTTGNTTKGSRSGPVVQPRGLSLQCSSIDNRSQELSPRSPLSPGGIATATNLQQHDARRL